MSERCGWVGLEDIYVDYHDLEWGVPEYDSRALWEKLVLDGFQAGLSWLTILKKRDNFRESFQGFDPNNIAEWTEDDVTRLLDNPGIVRHRGKIEATIGNAKAWQRIQQAEGFDNFLWKYVDFQPCQNTWRSQSEVPTQTPLSLQISKDLKKEGFRFCGPTIVYAFMEAVGMVNNHVVGCARHAEVAQMPKSEMRKKFEQTKAR